MKRNRERYQADRRKRARHVLFVVEEGRRKKEKSNDKMNENESKQRRALRSQLEACKNEEGG